MMLRSMQHRSPDGMKLFSDNNFSIGMGRLAIIDLESKNLCLYQEDKCHVAFNGEIYNYIELRDILKGKGYTFKTESDIEVLYKSYKEWGVDCLNRFNGMFAFAIYDGKQIFLARDIAGEKPLYYTEKPFRFASEAKALEFNCKEFPPAHYGIYDFDKLVIKKWWKFEPTPIADSTAEEELESILADSIALRTRSDVPYGLYYSGGIDSALIASFHDFDNQYTYVDKKEYEDEFLENFSKILWHLDYPIKSFSAFGLWKLAEMASKEVKVVLSGEGADELFGGYVRYVPNEFNRLAQKEFPSYKEMFPYSDMMWKEFNGNLRELLRMGDRMTSAFGIENRCPFLDRRVIEFGLSLTPEQKIKGLETKLLLRRILERRNPNYKHIEKKGLYCNVNEWIGSESKYGKKDYIEFQKKIWKKLV